jgi:hypothetical protein
MTYTKVSGGFTTTISQLSSGAYVGNLTYKDKAVSSCIHGTPVLIADQLAAEQTRYITTKELETDVEQQMKARGYEYKEN